MISLNKSAQKYQTSHITWRLWIKQLHLDQSKAIRRDQGLVKGAKLCFRNPYFYFWHGESTSTASQLSSPASQKSKDLNKVSLLLQDFAQMPDFAATGAMMAATREISSATHAILALTWFCHLSMCLWSLGGGGLEPQGRTPPYTWKNFNV